MSCLTVTCVQGVATLNLVTGSVACVVKSGDIICHLDELTQDSFMEVETGNIVVNIPTPCPFRSLETKRHSKFEEVLCVTVTGSLSCPHGARSCLMFSITENSASRTGWSTS